MKSTVGLWNNMQLFVDPSIIISRRGQDWLSRCVKDRPGVVSIISSLDGLLEHEWGHFRSSYFWWRSREPAAWWLRTNAPDHPHIPSNVPRIGEGRIELVVRECLNAIHSGQVMAARRFELLDMFVALGEPILHVGPDDYMRVLKEVRELLGDRLTVSLARRARYLAHTSHVPGIGNIITVADQGIGRY